MSADAVFCPECEDMPKMKTMQGAAMPWEGVMVYWRRKKCPSCKLIIKTLEVPADRLPTFQAVPESKEMA